MRKGIFFQRLIPLVTVWLLLVFSGISDTAEAGPLGQSEPTLTHWKKNMFDPNCSAVNPENSNGSGEGLNALSATGRTSCYRLFIPVVSNEPIPRPAINYSNPAYVLRSEVHLPCSTSPLLFPVHGFW